MGGFDMNINLTPEEAEVLRDILESEVDRLQIETLRTDTHAYHQLMRNKTECVERIVKKLKVEEKV
jgi:hypothetical protein